MSPCLTGLHVVRKDFKEVIESVGSGFPVSRDPDDYQLQVVFVAFIFSGPFIENSLSFQKLLSLPCILENLLEKIINLLQTDKLVILSDHDFFHNCQPQPFRRLDGDELLLAKGSERKVKLLQINYELLNKSIFLAKLLGHFVSEMSEYLGLGAGLIDDLSEVLPQ